MFLRSKRKLHVIMSAACPTAAYLGRILACFDQTSRHSSVAEKKIKSECPLLIFLAARWQWRMPIWHWGERLRAFAPLALQHIKAKPHLSKTESTRPRPKIFGTRRLTRKHAITMAEWFVQESWNSPAVCPCHTLLKGGNIKPVQPTCRFGKARFARWLPIRLFLLNCKKATPGAYGAWKRKVSKELWSSDRHWKSLKRNFRVWIHIEWLQAFEEELPSFGFVQI